MIELLRIPMKQVCGYFLRWYYNGWHYWHFLPGTLGYKTEGMKYRTFGTRTIELSSGVLNYEQVEAIRSILNTTEVYLFTDGGWAEIRLEPGSAIVLKNDLQGYEVTLKANIGSRQVSATGLSPTIVIPVAPLPTYCEVKIGTQIWMCANWDAAYPGSKVYNNDESNRAIYGGLYKYDQIMSAGFCPDGWRIPTDADWQTLLNFLGSGAGGKLKEIGTTHWDSPNTDASDDYDFTALGSGYGDIFGAFSSIKEQAPFWSATKIGDYNRQLIIYYDSAEAALETNNIFFYHFCPVRMIKNEAASYDWELQTIPSGGQILNDIMFYGTTGYAVGWTTGLMNLILKTTGTTWVQQEALSPQNLNSVFLLDADTVFACGVDVSGPYGCMRGTTDGGANWSTLTVAEPPAPGYLYDIMFTDANNGWAVGVTGSSKAYVSKTTDGGANWSIVTSPFSNDGILHSVFFIDANTGWVTGYRDSGFGVIYKHIYKTTNGGTSWTAQVSAFSGDAGSMRSIFMLDANTGWAVGNQGTGGGSLLIYHTVNGTSWTVQTSSVSSISGVLYGVHFIDANNGWCVGQSGTDILILTTTDGGTTWTQQTSIITIGSLRSVYAISETEAYAVGEDGSGNAIILKYG